MFYDIFSFPHGVGTLNLNESLPGPSILTLVTCLGLIVNSLSYVLTVPV